MRNPAASAFCLLALLVAFAASPALDACTTFCLREGGPVFGKNYDWEVADGIVLVNKRGVSKTADLSPEKKPASWVSRYGSVTFNQYGRESPSGGMNEAGLVIELMWLDETRYPEPDRRPGLGALEWIQYQLDRFQSVAEVVRNAGATRIVSQVPLHYLVCDRTGACASIEMLDGRLVPHTGGTLPLPVLANSTYADSLRFVETTGAGRGAAGYGSLQRFARASSLVKSYTPKNGSSPVAYAFGILDNVAQGAHTQWSIIYDMGARRIHYKTRLNPKIRRVDLSAFDFSCKTPVRVLDVHQGEGNVSARFADYRPEVNRRLIDRTFQATSFLASVPPTERAEHAAHAESGACTK